MTQDIELIAEIDIIIKNSLDPAMGEFLQCGIVIAAILEKLKTKIQADQQKQYEKGRASLDGLELAQHYILRGAELERQKIKQAVEAIEHEDIDEDFVYKSEVLGIIEGKS